MPKIEIVAIPNRNSFGTQETCKNVYKAISAKYRNTRLAICGNEFDLQNVVDRNPDLVILANKIMVDGSGQEMWLSEYFEAHNINYAGSIKEVLKYDLNKIASKLQVASHEIETARFFTALPNEYKDLESLPIPFPLFIKPLSSANSYGIDEKSFVINFAEFKSKVKSLYHIYKEPSLVEEYLSGREFTVSIIKTDTMLISPIEIIPPLKNDIRILSEEIKSNNTETLKKIIDINIYQKVSAIAKASFEALEARDFGRIDIKMDVHERCYFIEANLTPGMTKGSSYFPMAYELYSLLKYDEVMCLIVKSALKRQPLVVVEKPVIAKINKSIEIVILAGNEKRDNIAIHIDKNLILDILSKTYEKVVITIIETMDDLERLAIRNPDLVFSGVKYFSFNDKEADPNEAIWLNDFLDLHNISYIGSDRKALENEYDKTNAKTIMQEFDVNTADFFTTEPNEHGTAKSIPVNFPLFIKPINGGDSRGIDSHSIAHNFKSFQEKVLSIYQYKQSRSLVETYLSGKEYSVGIFNNNANGSITTMPVEIIPKENKNGERILDFDAKEDNSEAVILVLDIKIHAQISALAIIAFRALNGKSFGRIDIKMDNMGVPYFIEANLMPGLGEGYFYRSCFLNQKMNYEKMILMIADNGLSSGAISNSIF